MAQPVDIRNITPGAVTDIANAIAAANPNLDASEVEAAMTAALAASQPIDVNVVSGGSPTPFSTGQVAIPATPTITQLPSQATPTGVLLRASDDILINSVNSLVDSFIVYEGNDIRMTSISDLDQVFVTTVKNQPVTLYWMTL